MSDRGFPIVDGAPACPFVAFEDDRDGRATAPDHRHRCFAEPRPAPRALAHQEAYCLSSAFPVCPTFQDWARREAAAARPAAATTRDVEPEPPMSRPMPPLDREGYRVDDEMLGDGARRNQPRDWAAPPPWAGAAAGAGAAAASGGGGAAGIAAGGEEAASDAARSAAAFGAGVAAGGAGRDMPPEGRGLAGSAADRLAGPDPADPLASAPSRPSSTPAYGTAAAASPDRVGDDDVRPYSDPDAGHRSSAAAAGVGGAAAASWAAGPDDLDDEPDWGQPAATAIPDRGYPPPTGSRPAAGADARPTPPGPTDQVSRRQAQDPDELFGPAWERPRRYEAYPSLRTRVGLPALGGVGRVGLGALGLAVAALALFFIGPMLLGLGGDDSNPAGGGGTATSTPGVETASPDPTQVPEPTPQVYVVKKGDTMSKIANKFDTTIEALVAANPQIKNPNRIAIGDEVIIPVAGAVDDGTVEGASAAP